MGRYERRQFFESLVEMRDWYADRPDDDLPGAPLLIGDAMIHAAAVMGALEAEAAALAEAATAQLTATGPTTAGTTSNEPSAGTPAQPEV
jgi:hypothetical protein